MNQIKSRYLLAPMVTCLLALTSCSSSSPIGSGSTPHIDHYVPVASTAPSLAGQTSSLYVREVAADSSSPQGVVLFIHGAGTPAEVAFDVPVAGYSWMRYLADRGYATYAMDMTGYGRSYRPAAMNDRCNLSEANQIDVFGTACAGSHETALTTMQSDWDDIDVVVDWLLARHGIDKVYLVGWSQGGPRSAGYAYRHADKVSSLVLLAPAYFADTPMTPTDAMMTGAPLTKQTRTDFITNWDRQSACTDQYDPAVASVIFNEMLASDPVGATWGPGLRRAPRVPTFGWNRSVVAATTLPIMAVAGLQDAQVNPDIVRRLYADLGAERKVLLEMPCASHNAMWEKDATQLFDATYQWFSTGAWNGNTLGTYLLDPDE